MIARVVAAERPRPTLTNVRLAVELLLTLSSRQFTVADYIDVAFLASRKKLYRGLSVAVHLDDPVHRRTSVHTLASMHPECAHLATGLLWDLDHLVAREAHSGR